MKILSRFLQSTCIFKRIQEGVWVGGGCGVGGVRRSRSGGVKERVKQRKVQGRWKGSRVLDGWISGGCVRLSEGGKDEVEQEIGLR